MWHKAIWKGHPMRLELTRVGLLAKLANHYTTMGPFPTMIFDANVTCYNLIRQTDVCVYICVYVYTWVCVHVCVCVLACMCGYVCEYIKSRSNIYIYKQFFRHMSVLKDVREADLLQLARYLMIDFGYATCSCTRRL